MKTINILGQEVKIAFNMAVQIAYEDITDRAFLPSDITTRKAMLAFTMATIMANNPDTAITMQQLMTDLTFDEMQLLDKTAIEEMTAWYKVPATATEKEEGGRSKKHAKRP